MIRMMARQKDTSMNVSIEPDWVMVNHPYPYRV
ncbi:hypothetical protein J2X61_000703 [Bacillus sp. 3255]|nr:hypothetical protein [Bacillus sp. 3255]